MRYLAHHIIYRGEDHPLSVAEIGEDGSVSIEPYSEETEGTVFVSGTLDIDSLTPRHRIIQNEKKVMDSQFYQHCRKD